LYGPLLGTRERLFSILGSDGGWPGPLGSFYFEGCPVQASLGRGFSTPQSKSPETVSELAVMLDDARHLNAISPDKHVKKDL